MKKQHAMMLFVILTVMSVLSPGMVQGQSRNNIDVALVIDSSGSMKKTDPNSLRIPAAKLFISLLGGGDRAAVLSFSDQGYQLAGLTSLDSESDKEMLLHAAEKINSRGLYTNLYSAFSKGMEVLLHSREEDRDQIIILMSDGMIDVGNSAEDEQLLTMLKSDLSLELKNNNVKVYSIAFTDQSDRKLLEKLSKQTGGFYNLAMTDRDFHLIFTSIFESLKSPEMLPMDRNAFLIDPSVQEVTIVVSKESPDSDILIHAPDGQQYSGKKRYSGISWFESDNFDMITIQRPVEGRWKILYSTDENNKAYIITDLTLETNFEQLYAVFGENLAIKAWLEKEGSVIREGEVLETTEFFIELNNPDGKVSNLKPLNKGDGIFHKTITPFKDGNYRLRVVAKGQTFEREKAFLFNVANLQESKEDLKAAREARLADKKDQGVSEVQEEPINWLKISFQFLLINLFIGLLVVMYMKRQCIKDFKLLHRAFNRFKGETLQQTQEPVSGESGAAPANEINETVKNKNADIKKEKIILDEADPEAETEGNNIEGMKEPVAESSPVEEAESEAYVEEKSEENELSKLDAEIQRLEKLKQQDTDDQPAAVTKITAPENKEVAERREQDLAEDKEDEEEHVDDLWADALNEQAEAGDDTEKGESSKPEHAVPDEAVTEDVKETEEEQQADTADTGDLAEEKEDEEERVDDLWANAFNEQAEYENVKVKPSTGELDQINAEIEALERRKQQDSEMYDTSLQEIEEEHEVYTGDEELLMPDNEGEDEGGDDMWAAALDKQTFDEESGEKKTSDSIRQSLDETVINEHDSDMSADKLWSETLKDQLESSTETSPVNDKSGGTPGAAG